MKKNINSKKKRLTIAYVSTFLFDSFGHTLWAGISDTAKKYDANLISLIGTTLDKNDFYSQANIVYKFIKKNKIDGLILWTANLAAFLDKNRTLDFLKQYHDIPAISIGRLEEQLKIPTVYVDDESSIKIIMEHLVKHHNYQKIGFIRGPKNHEPSQIRYHTYLEELKKYNIEFDNKIISAHAEGWRIEHGIKSIKLFLDQRKLIPKTDIEAIITVGDYMALEAAEELKRRKYQIPDDIAVIGFNNSLESRVTNPPLTTFDLEEYSIGMNTVKILIDLINNKKDLNLTNLIQGELIVRESCGCFYQKNDKINIDKENIRISDNISEEYSRKIYNELMNSSYIKSVNLDFKTIQSILNSLASDLKKENPDKFVSAFQKFITFIKNENLDMDICLNLLSMIRKYVLSAYSSSTYGFIIENLMFQAQLLINNAVKNYFSLTEFKYSSRVKSIPDFGLKLMNVFKISDLEKILSKELIKLGIISCYISLFDDIKDPLKSSHLIFAYRDNKKIRFDIKKSSFPTQNLIPKELLPAKKPFQFIVQSLSNRGEQCGFVVFENESSQGTALEIIKNLINGALERSFQTEERMNLLKQLEKKVEERTTELKEANKKLRVAIERENSANKAKSDFLTTISHEIRTPLTVVIGLTEKMLMIDDKNMQNKLGSLIINESLKVTELINQLLDISKIEAGKLEIQNKPFSLINIMDELKEAFQVIAQKKGLNFKMIIDERINSMLYGDEMKLRQVLINLVGNAVKFTNSGRILVTADIQKKQKNKIIILFKVADTGIGIPKKKQKLIFNIFTQIYDSKSGKSEGSGLGTTISKQLVELMGGKIGFESAIGKGSTFWFTIPFKHVPNDIV